MGKRLNIKNVIKAIKILFENSVMKLMKFERKLIRKSKFMIF